MSASRMRLASGWFRAGKENFAGGAVLVLLPFNSSAYSCPQAPARAPRPQMMLKMFKRIMMLIGTPSSHKITLRMSSNSGCCAGKTSKRGQEFLAGADNRAA